MSLHDLWAHVLCVDVDRVLNLNNLYLRQATNFPHLEAVDVQKAWDDRKNMLFGISDIFQKQIVDRPKVEACVIQLEQCSDTLVTIHRANPQLQSLPQYKSYYTDAIAALRHMIMAVRLHFLLVDLKTISDANTIPSRVGL
jgi:hypothetical protein